MTIEIIGKRGGSFGRNLSGWCELVDYFHTVAPTVCARCKYWADDSLHDGLDAAGAVALADALQTEIDTGRTAVYAAFEHPQEDDIFAENRATRTLLLRTSPASLPSCAKAAASQSGEA